MNFRSLYVSPLPPRTDGINSFHSQGGEASSFDPLGAEGTNSFHSLGAEVSGLDPLGIKGWGGSNSEISIPPPPPLLERKAYIVSNHRARGIDQEEIGRRSLVDWGETGRHLGRCHNSGALIFRY